ncbi:cache domain-containing protein [Anaerovibrio sp. JC8]|uniref:cache domain-containing protein n=1 Tax=Anaerovibrio sp. JC8 TaxID=1240085 RepID=UPI001301F552|nr:cache domain-containing protein [Anaerovibrio sp. JC8]
MKLNIQQKALLLIGLAGLLTCIFWGGVLFWGLDRVDKELDSRSTYLVGTVTDEAENFATDEVRKRLEGIIRLKAYRINSVMGELEGDVLTLSENMTKLSQSKDSAPYALQDRNHDPRYSTIHSNEIYYLPGPNGDRLSPLAQKALSLEPSLVHLMESYDMTPIFLFVGSKDGWSLRMDKLASDTEQIKLPSEATTAQYDARDRVWYKLGEKAKATDYPVYTPLYGSLGDEAMVGCVMPYQDAEGFAGVVGMAVEPLTLYRKFADQVLDDSNISFVLNQQGQIIFSSISEGTLEPNRPDIDLRQTQNEGLAVAATAMAAGESGSSHIELDGKEYYLVYAPISEQGWSLGELVKLEEIQEPTRNIGLVVGRDMGEIKETIMPMLPQIRSMMAGSLGLLLVVLIIVSWRWAAKFAQPVKALSNSVGQVAKGNFDEKINIHTEDEIEELADSFNSMTDELKDYIEKLTAVTAEKAKIAAGLDVAAAIQQGMLPQEFPQNEHFSICASMEPSKEMTGDFYDFYYIDEHHLVLTIAEVSDTGIPAAIFMVVAKTLLKNAIISKGIDKLTVAVGQTNDHLAECNEDGLFITAFIGVLDVRNGELTYVKQRLGVSQGVTFSQQTVMLSPGDLIYLHTQNMTTMSIRWYE